MANLKVTHFFILHDEQVKPFSGAENHLWELLKGSSNLINIELLLSVGVVGPVINDRIQELLNAGVRVTLIHRTEYRFSSNRFLRILKECLIYSKAFKERKDRILHLHLNSNTIPVTAILSGHRNLFFTFHNDEPYFKKKISKFFLPKLLLWFRHTIAITEHVKKFLVNEAKLPQNKITVIRYGIKPPPMSNLIELMIPELPGKTKLCFVGRLTPQKNLFFFFECLQYLPDVSLVLIGDKGFDKERLINFAKSLGIDDKIYFYGYLDNASSYIHKFDFLCLPSKWEGLGLVLIEAMFQQTPIIGSDAGAIPEVLNYGELGTIISHDNVEKAVEVMRKAFSDSKTIQDKAKLAFEYANKNYTVSRMVQETINLYVKYSKWN